MDEEMDRLRGEFRRLFATFTTQFPAGYDNTASKKKEPGDAHDAELAGHHEPGWRVPEPDDATIARFLRARKHNAEAAVHQYISSETWRHRQGCHRILETRDVNEDVYEATCPHRNHKYDKQGRPVYIEKTGMIDLNTVLKYLAPDELVRRHIRQAEIAQHRMKKQSDARGTKVEQQIVILDLKHLRFTPSSTGIHVFRETIRIDQAYYPERLAHFFIINAPWIFTPLWAMIKPWLDPVTRDKFHVFGGGFEATLLDLIPAENLPAEYGGKCACDGGCVQALKPLPCTPDEWHARAHQRPKPYVAPPPAAAHAPVSASRK